jgi:hypothetical protein
MGLSDEENKQHDDIELPKPAPHKKGDKIDPKIEWEGVEDIDENMDFSSLKDLDMLEVLENAEQDARKKKSAAVEMQGMIAIKAIQNGADPVEVAKRCGFDISDPDHMHPNVQPGNRARFFGWLGTTFATVTMKKMEEAEND